LAVPAAYALVVAWVATRYGIGVTPDGMIYLDAARHLANGEGYVWTSFCTGQTAPLVHWPPLYSFLLSRGARLGVELMLFARVVQALLFAGSTLVVGRAVLARTRSAGATAVAGLLFATSLGMLEIHTAAWSEPLYLLLVLAALGWTTVAIERGGATALVAGAVAAGLAVLTRYVGGALVVSLCLAHLLLGGGAFTRRLFRAFVCGVVAALPIALFALRNLVLTGHLVDRQPGTTSGLTLEHGQALLVTVGSWLLPGADRLSLVPYQDLLVVAFALAVIVFLALRARGDTAVHGLFLAVYPVLFLLSIARFDQGSPVDQRNLAPLFPCALIIAVPALHRVLAGARPRRLFLAVIALFCAGHTAASLLAARHLWLEGRGFLAPRFAIDVLRPDIDALPPETRLYSNFPEAIQLQTGRRSCLLDRARSPAAILYFVDARHFTPRGKGANEYRGGGVDEVTQRAQRLRLNRVRRAGTLLFFSR